ncbi:MAG: RNA-binding S4 domain-containing protein [Bacillota bacterium]|nr:RNA-binding S4 domain-containing protein [Bacillota bacterium]
MRLDKYLKVSRLIKRRTVAKEVCEAGRIEVNGRPAKAGHDIAPGDEIKIALGNRRLTVKVAEVKETVRADQAGSLYEVIEDKKVQEEPLF